MKSMIACAIALGITATASFAQQGTFNLPVRAHWGAAVLEPGVHKVNMPVPVSQTILYLSGEEGTQMSVPVMTDRIEGSSRSYLHLAKVNGEYYVDQFNSGLSGKKFIFATPKATQPGEEVAEISVGVAAR